MKRFRAVATARQIPTAPVSARALAQMVNMPPPVSVTQLIAALLAPVTFHADITTPAGTALGGTVDLTLFSDGRYSFNVHMHDSGFDPYTFRVRCALQAPNGLILLFQASGHTDGSGSNLLGHVNRDFDHHENGQKAEIRQFWIDVRQSSLSVSKSYEDAGALHAIEDIAKDLLGVSGGRCHLRRWTRARCLCIRRAGGCCGCLVCRSRGTGWCGGCRRRCLGIRSFGDPCCRGRGHSCRRDY